MTYFQIKRQNFIKRRIHVVGKKKFNDFLSFMNIMESNEYDWKVFVTNDRIEELEIGEDIIYTLTVDYEKIEDYRKFCRVYGKRFGLRNRMGNGYIGSRENALA